MPVSNKQVADAMEIVTNFYSKYTGAELEESIELARRMRPFIDSNIAVPAAVFTGDFTKVVITNLTKDMWLESITLVCDQAFSTSSKDIKYEISADNATLVAIPPAFMQDEGTALEFRMNRVIHANTEIYISSTSTRAFGKITVKLNFR